MKRMEKLKSLFKEMPRPVLALFVVLVIIFVGLFVFFFMPGNKEKKAGFYSKLQSENQKTQFVSSNTSNNRTFDNIQVGSQIGTPEAMMKELKEKEKKVLTEKKSYFREVEGEEKTDSKKNVDLSSLPPPPPPPSYSGNVGGNLSNAPEAVNFKPSYLKFSEEFQKTVLAGYGRQPKGNILTYEREKKENATIDKNQQNGGQVAGQSGGEDIAGIIVPGKFYKATLINSVTSATGGNALVLAELQDLKGSILYGKIQGLIDETNRLDIVFNKLVYKGKTYSVNGIAFSLDKNQGVVSHLKYNVLRKIFTQGGLAFGESMMEALRKDETDTTTTFWGTQTTQKKSDNRFREGVLAGSSSAFGESKRIVQGYNQQLPDKVVIIEKGTPILVFFM